jgi:serine/threonine-protein kinase ATR
LTHYLDVLLNYIEGMQTAAQSIPRLLPFATEASWATGRWTTLEKYTNMAAPGSTLDFNTGIGQSLLALRKKDTEEFKSTIQSLREQIARSLSSATTSSLNACHEHMLRLHVLTELEMIAGTDASPALKCSTILESLDRRLEVVGSYLNDKQYLLGIRRAAMQLSKFVEITQILFYIWLTLLAWGLQKATSPRHG